MILGLSMFGFFHTVLCLVALVCGLVVIAGLLTGRPLEGTSALYFASAVGADVTGFGFSSPFGVPHYLGIAAGVALATAILARYVFQLAGTWRPIYAVATVASVHILVFFTIGEAFLRVPALTVMAPTLTERPFALTQSVVIVLFIALAIAAAIRFRAAPEAIRAD